MNKRRPGSGVARSAALDLLGPPENRAAAELDRIGARIEAGFREAVAQAIREAHAVGLPVATLDVQGGVAWRYPGKTE